MSSPATSARFLGIIIDSVDLQLHLSSDKLDKMQKVLREIEGKHKVTKIQPQRVGGILSHDIKGGQTFSRHIFNLIGEPCI